MYFLRYKHNKNKRISQKAETNQNKIENDQEPKKIDNEIKHTINDYQKDYCPRCGGLLVKRHGPYGDFYGCDNFSKTGCRYTRKFK